MEIVPINLIDNVGCFIVRDEKTKDCKKYVFLDDEITDEHFHIDGLWESNRQIFPLSDEIYNLLESPNKELKNLALALIKNEYKYAKLFVY